MDRRVGAGLAVSACVGSGQLANLTETARPSIAIELIEGAPSAVVPTFVTILKDEAAQHQIAVGAPGEVNYRLRGHLAVRDDEGKRRMRARQPPDATPRPRTRSAWTLDVYDGDQHRVIRLSGEEKAADRLGAAGDDPVLRRAARAGMDQLAAFLATSRTPSAAAPAVAPQRTGLGSGWLDDWTPEASGIFRLFGREPSRPAAETRVPSPADDVPLPRGRPAPADVASVTGDRAENDR